jgi:uncharacterized protein (TIGR00106 family)
MAIVQISTVPSGIGGTSISQHVARAVSVVKKERDVAYQLTPMGTVIEGDLDRVLGIVRQMHESGFGEGVQRVLTTIAIDDRRDKLATMESKVSSVQNKLGGS